MKNNNTCSFCLATNEDGIRYLILGLEGKGICDRCIYMCNDLIASFKRDEMKVVKKHNNVDNVVDFSNQT